MSKARNMTSGIYIFIHCTFRYFKHLFGFYSTFNNSQVHRNILMCTIQFNDMFLENQDKCQTPASRTAFSCFQLYFLGS